MRGLAGMARLVGCRWVILLLIGLVVACGGVPEQPAPESAATNSTDPASPAAITAPTPPRLQGTLTVFAAASLTEAFNEAGGDLGRAGTDVKISFNFAGSQTLRTQLREGARGDLFASADELTMQMAQQDGTIAGEPRIFVQNKLVVIMPAQQSTVTGLADLTKPGLKLVLAQESVPVGAYARQALTNLSSDPTLGSDFATRVLANLVSQETNVKQVVAKVQLGEADAGIVYASDVTPAVRARVKTIAIPDQFNVIARYPIAVVKGAANEAGAAAFIAYLLSPAGQATLERHGFIPVTTSPRAAASHPASARGLATSGWGTARAPSIARSTGHYTQARSTP